VLSVKCCCCWECRPLVRVGVDRQPEYCEDGDVYIPWIYVDFHSAIKLTLFSLPGVFRALPHSVWRRVHRITKVLMAGRGWVLLYLN
jgi:hypothetical protein